MSISSVQSALSEPFNPYPDSASDTPYTTEAEAGAFFSTLLDIINPLQHIPLVSNLYRELTGDEIEPAARMVGGAVFGGPLGFASASANVLLEQASGDDLLGHAVALFSGDETAPLDSLTADPEMVAEVPKDAGSALVATAETASAETIVWAGPRVIPALAGDVNSSLIQQVAENSSSSTTLEKPTTDARETPWLNEARTTAAANLSARENGQVVPLASPQPWVATAMLEALDKYDALARARTDGDRNEPADNPDDIR